MRVAYVLYVHVLYVHAVYVLCVHAVYVAYVRVAYVLCVLYAVAQTPPCLSTVQYRRQLRADTRAFDVPEDQPRYSAQTPRSSSRCPPIGPKACRMEGH